MTGRKLPALPAADALVADDIVYFERAGGSRKVTLDTLLDALDALKSFGSLFMQDNTTATSIPSDSTFVKVAGTTEAGLTQRMAATTNRLTRGSGANLRRYSAQAILTAEGDANTIVEAALYVGGVDNPGILAASRFKGTIPSGGRPLTLATGALLELPGSAWVEVWIARPASTGALTVTDLRLDAVEVG